MIQARPYQTEENEATREAWAAGHRSCLVVSPTGTGKTEMFIQHIRDALEKGIPVMVIVDRLELVTQTVDRIIKRLGVYPDIEQGDLSVPWNKSMRSPVCVAIVQSLRTEYDDGSKRYEKFRPTDYGLILIDEAHLSITPSYMEIVNHFVEGNPDARVAGFTATPKRGDGRSLAQLYPHCPFEYRMIDAINDGWLVPVHGKIIPLESVSLRGLKVSGRGDYTDNQIGAIMEDEDALYQTVSALVAETKETETRRAQQTIVFCARVAHARLMAEAINKMVGPDSARAVYGDMPNEQRRPIINNFKERNLQYLVNCAVLTTGFDAPCIDVVAMCRPTKSWSLFTQCVGRGTRVLPNVVDGLETAEERHKAIRASLKPQVTVLSFVGREGSMNLVGPEDVLAGDMEPPEVLERAKELLDEAEDDADVLEILEEAREQIEDESQRPEDAMPDFTIDGVNYDTIDTDWFNKNDNFVKVLKSSAALPDHHARSFLEAAGYRRDQVARWEPEKRERVVKYLQQREADKLCSLKQANLIRRMFPRMTEDDRKALTKRDAGRLISMGKSRGKLQSTGAA